MNKDMRTIEDLGRTVQDAAKALVRDAIGHQMSTSPRPINPAYILEMLDVIELSVRTIRLTLNEAALGAAEER